jgi:3-hydroxyisobutyrate dehydrogenase-like beta-hydroxyacid dehydrogenase
VTSPPPPPPIGWIGLGHIGRPMAARVLQAGFPLTVWARRREAAQPLLDAGAAWADDPVALAQAGEIVVTVVGGPDDVQALHAQMMPAACPGTVFVDATTAAPRTAAAAAALAALHGLRSIDAPVTGGVAGAQRGTLTSFVGGEADAIERARPLLAAYSARLVPCGAPGSGYRVKLVNQTVIAGVLLGLADAARLARAAGIAADELQAALAGGTASGFLFDAYLGRMVNAGGPVSFSLGLLHKDLRLARDEARALGVQPQLLDAAIAALEAAIARHGAKAGVQMLAAD